MNKRHILYTRYNLGLYSENKFRKKLGCDPDTWMQHRYKLFTTFTLPSIANQSCKNFIWYLFMDRATPQPFVEQLEDLALPNMRLVLMRERQIDFLKREIQLGKEPYIITSRIDNDDAFHTDYIKTIQKAAVKPRQLIDFQDSYLLNLSDRKLWFQKIRWYNHAKWWWRWKYLVWPKVSNSPSMFEDRDHAITVQCAEHTDIIKKIKRSEFVPINNKPYRLIICHDHNLVNTAKIMRNKFHQVETSALQDFHVPVNIDAIITRLG